MIYLYSGTPGSGKSLHVAKKIIGRLRCGRPVICNFDVDLQVIKGRRKKIGEFKYIENMNLTVESLIKFSEKYFSEHRFREGEITLILDECQLLFNARTWGVKGRNNWISFFSQHRKYGYDIILVAQFDRMVDRQIRSLIEYEVIHRKVSNFGVAGKIFSLLFLGKMHIAITMWYPLQERIASELFAANKRFYAIYDTRAHFLPLGNE